MYAICEYCLSGCKCGREIMSEGTCIFCGHGIPEAVDPYVEHATRHMRMTGNALDARVVPSLRSGRATRWTADAIVRAIRMWARDTGHAPTAKEWARSDPGHPAQSTCAKLFGSWADAIESAGFQRPTRARRLKVAA